MKFKQLILATCAAVTMYAVPASAINLTIGTDSENPNLPDSGSNLIVTNGDQFSAASGYKLPMTQQTTGLFEGLYQAGELIFTALHYGQGGPKLSSFIAIGVDSRGENDYSIKVDGPAGATFSFWEAGATQPTFSLETGTKALQTIYITGHGTPEDNIDQDPFGSITGRNFTVDKPGIYTVTFLISDLSPFGDGAGRIHAPVFYTMTFEATAAAIPEPSTFALLGLAGVAGGAAFFRNRRNKA
jgi:hypothetical protein